MSCFGVFHGSAQLPAVGAPPGDAGMPSVIAFQSLLRLALPWWRNWLLFHVWPRDVLARGTCVMFAHQ
eukprot:15055991-Alexandrium_andersonii.AAC.1